MCNLRELKARKCKLTGFGEGRCIGELRELDVVDIAPNDDSDNGNDGDEGSD